MRLFARVLHGGALLLLLCSSSYASIVTIGEKDFDNGDFLLQSTYNAAQADDLPVPTSFFEFRGADLNNSSPGNWSDNIVFSGYGAGAVTYATITLGLWDHDSAATGNQVLNFSLGAVDLTAELNALLNASGGVQNGFPVPTSEYNVYTLVLNSSTFADLADGSATFALEFQNGRGLVDSPYNGVGLDFAELALNEPPAAVPEPASLLAWSLLGLGGAAGLGRRHLRRRKQRS